MPTQHSQKDQPKTEPSWVSYAQGGGATAAVVFAAALTVVGRLQWRTYKTQARIMVAQFRTIARSELGRNGSRPRGFQAWLRSFTLKAPEDGASSSRLRPHRIAGPLARRT